MKKIAMIPIALGSKRVKDKNLLLINGDLMVSYVVDACKKANIFDEIYINSEHKIFETLADRYGVKFYHRPATEGGGACTMKNISSDCQGKRCQVHDHFIYDFLGKVSCDLMFMIHTTSPLIKPETIKNFVAKMIEANADSFFACTETRKESFIEGKAINFDGRTKVPTQDLMPIQSIAWAITGWKSASFKNAYANGPTYNGKMGLFPISALEALDVDTWEDFYMVEACLAYKNDGNKHFYYDEKITGIQRDLKELINQDGVPGFDASQANALHTNIDEIKKKMGAAPWCHVVAYSDSDQCCYIAQPPGDGCRTHCHVTKDEWWYVVEGEFKWSLPFEGKTVIAKAGETVFLPKGTVHKITCISKTDGIRLAHGARDMEHIYYDRGH